jgi:hypothetical protein
MKSWLPGHWGTPPPVRTLYTSVRPLGVLNTIIGTKNKKQNSESIHGVRVVKLTKFKSSFLNTGSLCSTYYYDVSKQAERTRQVAC